LYVTSNPVPVIRVTFPFMLSYRDSLTAVTLIVESGPSTLHETDVTRFEGVVVSVMAQFGNT
jgi:hypothetical protein